MNGTKISKPLSSETEKQYTKMAEWCNIHQCIIKECDGYYVVSEPEKSDENETENLRFRREQECFTVINRGQFWHDTLSLDQKRELAEWYHAWLNVTTTKQVPATPSWIDGKTSQ